MYIEILFSSLWLAFLSLSFFIAFPAMLALNNYSAVVLNLQEEVINEED